MPQLVSALPRIVAGAVMPLPAAPAEGKAETVGPVMQTLSAYMSEASSKALPDEVTEKTKRHVLDTLAAMISGSALPPGAFGVGVCNGIRRKSSRDGGVVEIGVRPDRSGANERDAGACRRDG